MNEQEIRDWRKFCEGGSAYTPDHFSSLFMECFLEPLTDKDKNDLRTVLSLVPGGTRVLEKMLRLDDSASHKSNEELKELVASDLIEMRKIIHSTELLAVIDAGVIEIISDDGGFEVACDCKANRLFIHELSEFFLKLTRGRDARIRALSNAFYGLSNNMHLQWSLTADLLNLDVNFDNYFELYLVGVDYAVCADRVTVMDYRAKHAASL